MGTESLGPTSLGTAGSRVSVEPCCPSRPTTPASLSVSHLARGSQASEPQGSLCWGFTELTGVSRQHPHGTPGVTVQTSRKLDLETGARADPKEGHLRLPFQWHALQISDVPAATQPPAMSPLSVSVCTHISLATYYWFHSSGGILANTDEKSGRI